MRAARRVNIIELGPTYVEWQSQEFFGKRFTPRRRNVRHVESQRIRGTYVNQRLVIGESRRSMPLRLTEWPNALKIIAFTAVLIAAIYLAGGRIELP